MSRQFKLDRANDNLQKKVASRGAPRRHEGAKNEPVSQALFVAEGPALG